jgi:hypothetical protein
VAVNSVGNPDNGTAYLRRRKAVERSSTGTSPDALELATSRLIIGRLVRSDIFAATTRRLVKACLECPCFSHVIAIPQPALAHLDYGLGNTRRKHALDALSHLSISAAKVNEETHATLGAARILQVEDPNQKLPATIVTATIEQPDHELDDEKKALWVAQGQPEDTSGYEYPEIALVQFETPLALGAIKKEALRWQEVDFTGIPIALGPLEAMDLNFKYLRR